MGIQWCYYYKVFVLVIFYIYIVKYVSAYSQQICQTPGCNCTSSVKPWKTINCTFNNTQKIELHPDSIPPMVTEFFIIGGYQLTVLPHVFQSQPGLAMIGIDGTRNVFVQKQSFFNITAPSLRLEIQNCDRVVIETGAFKNIMSSIVEIKKIEQLTIKEVAFSKLQEGRFKDIKNLELSEGSFQFDQTHPGRHGPVTVLSFDNVVIPKIPKGTFASTLAEINIQYSEINDIQKEAFKALQISVVTITHTTIYRLRTGAFKEQTLIYNFTVSKCNISILEAKAVTAAITNLTVQHSRLTDIHGGAITSTVANAMISDNEVGRFQTASLVLTNWNKINIDNNIVKYLYSGFLEATSTDITEFSFIGNEIYNASPASLNFLSSMDKKYITFDNNFFNHTCQCDIREWLKLLVNSSDVQFVMNSSFCTIDALLSRCFQLKEGLINMENFTELICNDSEVLKCEPYSGETKVIDTTSKILLIDEHEEQNNTWILIIVIGALLIIALSGTIMILLIRGGLWLKRQGYFRNMHYNQNEVSNDDENTIVTVDRNDKPDLPDELTPELLQALREQLEDPLTHNEAREMIERLYDLFIVDESYTNNNRQDEEAHLYEELGNLQQPQPDREVDNGPITYLRVMQERFNIQTNEENRPALVVDYSEPSDAAVHLYSELKQSKLDCDEKKDSLKSAGSGNMSFRPLPDKPQTSTEPGPSTKY